MLAKSVQAVALWLVLTEVGECQLDITNDPKFLPQESSKESGNSTLLGHGCPGVLTEDQGS